MKKSKFLFSAVMVIVLCASLITGATFALFTSGDEVNVAVTSGTVEVEAYLDGEISLSSDYGYTLPQTTVSAQPGGNTVTITNMVPGDKVEFSISVYNKSNVDVKYQTVITIDDEESDLYEALEITVGEVTLEGETEVKSGWNKIGVSEDQDVAVTTVDVCIYMPIDTLDTYQGKTLNFTYSVVAIQGNAYTGPKANLTTLSEDEYPAVDDSLIILQGENAFGWGIDFPTTINMDEAEVACAYLFSADETGEEAIAKGYDGNWVCDFIIECEEGVEWGELGLMGAYGAYEDGDIVSFANPVALEAHEKLAMLTWVYANTKQVGPIPYPAVCDDIGAFGCGLFTPYNGAMAGKTVTVSLVMVNLLAIAEDFGGVNALENLSKENLGDVMAWIEANYSNEEKVLVVNKTEYEFSK